MKLIDYSTKIFDILRRNRLIPSVNPQNVFFTSFGRTGLYMILKALDCQDKKVLLPAFTCPESVVRAVTESGGIPVFVDIEPSSLNFDMGDLRRKISGRSVAIVSHHYFGMVNTEVEENHRIAREHGLVHIEDCCHSMGATFRGAPVGSSSDVSFYSFAKVFGGLSGGVVVCRSERLARRIENYLSQAQGNSVSPAEAVMKAFHFMNYSYTLWIMNSLIRTRKRTLLKGAFNGSLFFLALAGCFAGFMREDIRKLRRTTEFKLTPHMAKIQYMLIDTLLQGRIISFKRRKRDKLFQKIKSLPFICDDFDKPCSFNDLYVVLKGSPEFIRSIDKLAERSNFAVSLPWINENCFRNEQYLEGVIATGERLRIIHAPINFRKGDFAGIYRFLKECIYR